METNEQKDNLKSIDYQDYVNLENCEREPIQFLGKVQSHGYLLAYNRFDLEIEFVSENFEQISHLSNIELLSAKITDLFDDSFLFSISQFVNNRSNSIALTYQYSNKNYSLTAFETERHIVIEIENAAEKNEGNLDLFNYTREFLDKINLAQSLEHFFQVTAQQIKQLTHFDRVMVYRFDEQHNGEVFAEAVNPEHESFLGLRYPHTDIPPQARKLYSINPIRTISDINSNPVSILTTIKEATHQSLDLTHSSIRSVSPIHIEYLKNMGVGASMSISIMVENKLWGLIACHHYSPLTVPYFTRTTAQQFVSFLSSLITPKLVAEESKKTREINETIDHFSHTLRSSENIISDILKMDELFEFIEADSLVINSNSQIHFMGEAVDYKSILLLYDYLYKHVASDHFYTNDLRTYLDNEAIDYNKLAGVAYFNFGNGESMIWIRKSVEQIVNWGGNPEKAIIKNTSKNGLSPRKSFELWKQIVRGKSKQWESYQIEGARRLAHVIHNHILLNHLKKQDENLSIQNQFLKEKNQELETFNQICSHDLQEPARKIRVFSNLLREKGKIGDDFTLQTIGKIEKSAIRLEDLILSLLHLTRVTKKNIPTEIIDLNKTIEEVKSDLELKISERKVTIISDVLPSIKAAKIQMQQLFMNLINNSIKYSDKTPEIRIGFKKIKSFEVPDFIRKLNNVDYYCISVSDNGIGFDLRYADRIFDIFQRLHNDDEYHGSGIGLAICKKIVEQHSGTITVSSVINDGSVFNIYLPAKT